MGKIIAVIVLYLIEEVMIFYIELISIYTDKYFLINFKNFNFDRHNFIW